MHRNDVNWSGNFCAVITPFTQSGELDEAAFVKNLELLLSEGIDGFVVAGHTGEAWALDDEERFRIFELARDVSSGSVPVIGAASAIRTVDSIRLAKGAERSGIDGLLLTPPAYAMVNEREMLAHFQAVSDACPLPIMLYNIPRRIGREISPQFMVQAAEVPNVVALKQSGPSFDEIAAVVNLVGDRIAVFAGNSAERGLPAVSVGADGFISSVETQALGAEAISLYRLAKDGDIERARKVQARTAKTKKFLGQFGTEPASLKVAMNHIGRPGGYPRPPILPITEEEANQVTAFMDEILSASASA
jgi:4-hydroxy-tetrahydrodipicolinate synthase